jgi:eukaryotic-like serine/threonine-protein kinase
VRACALCCSVFRADFDRCPTDGGELVLSDTDPLLGRTIADRYVVEALIGEGAMGRVYRARHRTLPNQCYALKVLIGDLAASQTMRLRFAREAENASRLDHPNVVNVIDYGKTARGVHFLIMDLIEGCSLADLVRQGPMTADRVIRIAHQLCEGLDHAHSRGVIHRDFKAENILIVNEHGREIARIADFGLAMSTTRDVRLTTTGVACTPAYAAPEQLRGADIDHRVDLYGLGATVFEMLSGGYLPFEGDLDTTISSKLRYEAPSILTRAPCVPPGLVTLVSRLLAHEPDQRPRSARAVIRALETSMMLPRPALRTVEMRPIAKRRTAQRSRWRALKSGVLVSALATMAAFVVHTDRDELVSGPRTAQAAPAVAVQAAAVPVVVTPLEQVVAPLEQVVTPLEQNVTPATPIEQHAGPAALPGTEAPAAVPRSPAADLAPAHAAAQSPPPRKRSATKREAGRRTYASIDGPSALEVATHYRDVGRRLAEVDDAGELRRRYDRIQIADAMSSQDARNSTTVALARIERALAARD